MNFFGRFGSIHPPCFGPKKFTQNPPQIHRHFRWGGRARAIWRSLRPLLVFSCGSPNPPANSPQVSLGAFWSPREETGRDRFQFRQAELDQVLLGAPPEALVGLSLDRLGSSRAVVGSPSAPQKGIRSDSFEFRRVELDPGLIGPLLDFSCGPERAIAWPSEVVLRSQRPPRGHWKLSLPAPPSGVGPWAH